MAEPDETIPGLLVSEVAADSPAKPTDEELRAMAWQRIDSIVEDVLRDAAYSFRPARSEALKLAIIKRLDVLIDETRSLRRELTGDPATVLATRVVFEASR
jgi:hypothetical protein